MTGSMADGWIAWIARQPETEVVPVEAVILLGVVLGLVLFDILALRFGKDSRPEWKNPRNWT